MCSSIAMEYSPKMMKDFSFSKNCTKSSYVESLDKGWRGIIAAQLPNYHCIF